MKRVVIDLTSTDLQILKTSTTEIRQQAYMLDEQGNVTDELIDVILIKSNRNPM